MEGRTLPATCLTAAPDPLSHSPVEIFWAFLSRIITGKDRRFLKVPFTHTHTLSWTEGCLSGCQRGVVGSAKAIPTLPSLGGPPRHRPRDEQEGDPSPVCTDEKCGGAAVGSGACKTQALAPVLPLVKPHNLSDQFSQLLK